MNPTLCNSAMYIKLGAEGPFLAPPPITAHLFNYELIDTLTIQRKAEYLVLYYIQISDL